MLGQKPDMNKPSANTQESTTRKRRRDERQGARRGGDAADNWNVTTIEALAVAQGQKAQEGAAKPFDETAEQSANPGAKQNHRTTQPRRPSIDTLRCRF
jgi:hypothetical protein